MNRYKYRWVGINDTELLESQNLYTREDMGALAEHLAAAFFVYGGGNNYVWPLEIEIFDENGVELLFHAEVNVEVDVRYEAIEL